MDYSQKNKRKSKNSEFFKSIKIPLICLICSGLFFVFMRNSRPLLNDYSSQVIAEGVKGHTEPEVVGPGDKFKVTIASNKGDSLMGLWKVESFEAQFFVGSPKDDYREIKLPYETIVTDEESWNTQINHFVIGEKADPNGERIKNLPFYPWIKIKLPMDERYWGKTLIIKTKMEGMYPFYLWDIHKYTHYAFSVDSEISLNIATKKELASYKKWQGHYSLWEFFGIFGKLAAFVFLGSFVVIIGTFMSSLD